MEIKCPYCGTAYESDEDVTGRKVYCSNCNKKFLVGQASKAAFWKRACDILKTCLKCVGTHLFQIIGVAVGVYLSVLLTRVTTSIEKQDKTISASINSLRSDVRSIKSDLGSIESDVSSIRSDVGSIESDVSHIKRCGVQIER